MGSKQPEGKTTDKTRIVVRQIEASIALNEQLLPLAETVVKISETVIGALRKGNKVLLFGNGGSDADAQHIAGELMGRFYRDRPPLPALPLTTNTASLTAIANDYSYDDVFARQIEALASPGDVTIGISTSGNSRNVIRGIEMAKQRGAITIALVGQKGKLNDLADFCLAVPSTDTPRIQEMHMLIGHIMCLLVESALFVD